MNHNESRQIFLGNLSYDATPDEVVAELRQAGIGAARVRIATWRETGAPRGFGFLDLESTELRSIEDVIDYINASEVEIRGRVLRADRARARTSRPLDAQEERARNEATWQKQPRRKGKKPKRGSGSRGHIHNEFQRGCSEFED